MSSADPYEILGLTGTNHTDEEVARAFDARLEENRDAEEHVLESLHEAYGRVCSAKRRLEIELFGLFPLDGLDEVLPEVRPVPGTTPALWIEMLRLESARRESPYPRRKS